MSSPSRGKSTAKSSLSFHNTSRKLNRLRCNTRILGAVQMPICFVASLWSLHSEQYHLRQTHSTLAMLSMKRRELPMQVTHCSTEWVRTLHLQAKQKGTSIHLEKRLPHRLLVLLCVTVTTRHFAVDAQHTARQHPNQKLTFRSVPASRFAGTAETRRRCWGYASGSTGAKACEFTAQRCEEGMETL